MPCPRNTDDHCCYISGRVCPFLTDLGEGLDPRWSCGLRAELGSWEAVHVDARYLEVVRPEWNKINRADGSSMPDCGDWPRPGEQCATCGTVGVSSGG